MVGPYKSVPVIIVESRIPAHGLVALDVIGGRVGYFCPGRSSSSIG